MSAALTTYPARQFALVRIGLGLYSAVFSARLLPYAGELFAAGGLSENQWRGFMMFREVFPNILDLASTPGAAQLFLLLHLVAALALAAGCARRVTAIVVWYGFACMVHRNMAVMNPAIAFIGWVCLASTLIPRGEGWSWKEVRPLPNWYFPRSLWRGAWMILALGYSVSGYAKLDSPTWVDGSALALVVDMPHAARHPLADLVRNLPAWLMQLATWIALAGELLFAPLSVHWSSRSIAWSIMTIMHVALLVLMNFREISVAMLLVHAFTFDARWPVQWRALLAPLRLRASV